MNISLIKRNYSDANMMHVECENKIRYDRRPFYKINTDYSMEKHIDGLV